jgi:hypothetical protein
MIDPTKVEAILLTDGWHHVEHVAGPPRFELVSDGWEGTGSELGGTPNAAFLMTEAHQHKTLLTGPLSSILAVRYWSEAT